MAIIKREGSTGTTYQVKIRKKGFKTLTKTFPKKGLAQDWERDQINKMNNHQFVDMSEAEKMTFGEAIDEYVKTVSIKKKGYKEEKNKAKRIKELAEFVDQPLSRIKPKDIREYRVEREKHVAANTVRNDFNLISNVFKEAASEWGMDNLPNPTESVKRPPPPKGRDRRFRDGEEEKIIEYLDKIHNIKPWVKPCMMFLWTIGMRREEAAKMSPSDVDLENRTIWLGENKTDYPRHIPIPKATLDILKSFEWGTETVFGVKPDTMTNAWRGIMADMIEDGHVKKGDALTLHDLRHEATSRHFEAKAPDGTNALNILQVQLMTGHKDLNTLKRYVQLRASSVVDTMKNADY